MMTYTEQSVDIVRETDTGEWRFSKALCKGCGLCIEVCEPHASEFSTELGPYGSFIIQPSAAECTGCNQCADICPDGAITFDKREARSHG